jgi:hypothetical protein
MSEWISVKDKAPKTEDYILITDVNLNKDYGYNVAVGYYDLTFEKYFAADDFPLDCTTHWQPLPKPPKE